MRIFKVSKADAFKISEKNIEPIKITELEDGSGIFTVEVEEDVDIDAILSPPVAVPVSKKEKKEEKKVEKKKKKKKK